MKLLLIFIIYLSAVHFAPNYSIVIFVVPIMYWWWYRVECMQNDDYLQQEWLLSTGSYVASANMKRLNGLASFE